MLSTVIIGFFPHCHAVVFYTFFMSGFLSQTRRGDADMREIANMYPCGRLNILILHDRAHLTLTCENAPMIT